MPDHIYVHRDLGPGFTHFNSPSCGCRPHVIAGDHPRTTEAILAEIDAKEKRGDA